MLLPSHDSLVAFQESHVRPAGVDGRDVAADGVDSLDTLAAVTFSKTKSSVTSARIASTSRAKNASR
jgi:hypothetical protein